MSSCNLEVLSLPYLWWNSRGEFRFPVISCSSRWEKRNTYSQVIFNYCMFQDSTLCSCKLILVNLDCWSFSWSVVEKKTSNKVFFQCWFSTISYSRIQVITSYFLTIFYSNSTILKQRNIIYLCYLLYDILNISFSIAYSVVRLIYYLASNLTRQLNFIYCKCK